MMGEENGLRKIKNYGARQVATVWLEEKIRNGVVCGRYFYIEFTIKTK